MATYAIGDIQGCFAALTRLLDIIQFDENQDQLWLAGDLVNRGEDSLATLKLLYKLDSSVRIVLGNHDLHLLAIARGHARLKPQDTLRPIIEDKDCHTLMEWLRCQPLFIKDNDWVMTHAGIYPFWTINQASAYAAEVEAVLQSDQLDDFLVHMYGNKPESWGDDLVGYDRLRFITNALTRMRLVGPNGELDMQHKSTPDLINTNKNALVPWFEHEQSLAQIDTEQHRLIFGHWAALEGQCSRHNVFALDTGCVWGGQLTALRLDDQQIFQVAALTG